MKFVKFIFLTAFVLIVGFVFLLTSFFFSSNFPVQETCAESPTIINDNSGNYLKLVQCIKGYKTTAFPDGGFKYHTWKSSGLVVSSKTLTKTYKIPNSDEVFALNNTNYLVIGTGLYLFDNGQISKIKELETDLHPVRWTKYSGSLTLDNGNVYSFEANTIKPITIKDISTYSTEHYKLRYESNAYFPKNKTYLILKLFKKSCRPSIYSNDFSW